MTTRNKDDTTWLARSGQDKEHNRRGQGVGYRTGKAGQRLYVAYTQSCTLHRVTKEQASGILIAMANGTWTGGQTLAATWTTL